MVANRSSMRSEGFVKMGRGSPCFVLDEDGTMDVAETLLDTVVSTNVTVESATTTMIAAQANVLLSAFGGCGGVTRL